MGARSRADGGERQLERRLLKRIWAVAKNCLDYHVSRNQVFHCRADYVWAMLICLSLNRRSMFKLVDLVGTFGTFAFIPFIIVTILLHHTMVYLDVFAGIFPGSGIVATLRKVCPPLGGVGTACIIYCYYQLIRDYADLSLVIYYFSRTLRSGYRSLCDPPIYPAINGFYHRHQCYSLRSAFFACANASFTVNYTAFPALPVYDVESVIHDKTGFAHGVATTSLVLLAGLFLLTLLNVRKYTRFARFLIPAFLVVEFIVLLTAGLQFRINAGKEFPDCSLWGDIFHKLGWGHFRASARNLDVWIQSAFLAMDMLAAATGITTGLSRRMALGQPYDKSNLIITTTGVVSHIVFGAVCLIACPRVMMGTAYPVSRYSKLYAWDWILFASESIQASSLGKFGAVCACASICVCMLSRIFYIVDCLRNAITEYLSRFGYEEESIDDWRARLAPAVLGFTFLVGITRFATPSGAIADEWMRFHQGESFGRITACCLIAIIFYVFYRERRISKDLVLVTKNKALASYTRYRILKFGLTAFIYPVLLLHLLAAFIYFQASDKSARQMLHDVSEFLPDLSEAWENASTGMRYVYWCIPLLPVVTQLGWDVVAALVRRESVSGRFHPSRDWGPSEVRFWEADRRYKHLFYDYGGMLDEEREELLGELRKAKGRNLSASHITGAPTPAAKPKADQATKGGGTEAGGTTMGRETGNLTTNSVLGRETDMRDTKMASSMAPPP